MDFLRPLSNAIIKLNKIVRKARFCTWLAIAINLILISSLYAANLNQIITSASENYEMPAELVYSIIEVESSFNTYAVSRCDARGLMQITRPTWDWICQDYLKVSWPYEENCFDPEKNIIVGTRFLKWIKDYLKFHEKELEAKPDDLLLACYNAGPGIVKSYGFKIPPYAETQNYIAKITDRLRQ